MTQFMKLLLAGVITGVVMLTAGRKYTGKCDFKDQYRKLPSNGRDA